jgi:hypothetical protein
LDEEVVDNLEKLIITSSAYMNEKDCVPTGQTLPPCKYVQYTVYLAGKCAGEGVTNLKRPHIITAPFMPEGWKGKKIDRIEFCNGLSSDVKVSVLGVRTSKRAMCEEDKKCA